MQICNDAAETFERLGSPEGELALGQAVIYLAVAPKSNAGYNAFNTMRALVAKEPSRAVPVHLRNAPTKLMKELGYGKAYRYAHDEPEAYAAGESYLPDDMDALHVYQPTPRGLEGKIAEKLKHLAELDAAIGAGVSDRIDEFICSVNRVMNCHGLGMCGGARVAGGGRQLVRAPAW